MSGLPHELETLGYYLFAKAASVIFDELVYHSLLLNHDTMSFRQNITH